jgi:hypothetical protein
VNRGQHLLQSAFAAGAVTIDAIDPGIRKTLRESVDDPLGAETEGAQISITALLANLRHLTLGSAVVTAQTPAGAMVDHVRIATAAVRLPATPMADENRRVTAPVDEQQHLLAVGQTLFDGVGELLRDPLLEGLAAQIHNLDPGHQRPLGTPRESQALVAAAGDVVETLQRRGRATQQYRNPALARPHDGQIPSRVTKALLLLERGVMLLVDDEQTRPRKGREHRRTRPHHHGGAAVTGRGPGLQTLPIAQARVQHRHRHRQPVPKACDDLRCQSDFGNQHHRLATQRDDALDDGQVYLCFTAARHPVQQIALKTTPCRVHGLDGVVLLVGGSG